MRTYFSHGAYWQLLLQAEVEGWNTELPPNFTYLLIEIALVAEDRLTLSEFEVWSPLLTEKRHRQVFLHCNAGIFCHHPGEHISNGKIKRCYSFKSVLSLKVSATGFLFADGLGFFRKGDKQETGISPARSCAPAELFHPTTRGRSRAVPVPHLPVAAWWIIRFQGCGSKGRDQGNPASLWTMKTI